MKGCSIPIIPIEISQPIFKLEIRNFASKYSLRPLAFPHPPKNINCSMFTKNTKPFPQKIVNLKQQLCSLNSGSHTFLVNTIYLDVILRTPAQGEIESHYEKN